MKLLFTRENRFEVNAMRAFLESHGILGLLKNEFSSSIMGEIPFTETWPELWVADAVFEAAKELVDSIDQEAPMSEDWQCLACDEVSPGSFDFCWSCSELRSSKK